MLVTSAGPYMIKCRGILCPTCDLSNRDDIRTQECRSNLQIYMKPLGYKRCADLFSAENSLF